MKYAIIIGASSGIGYQIAKQLVLKGWVVGVAARRTERLEQLADERPGQIFTATIDVNEAEAPHRLRDLIRRTGGMNLYIHTAGVGKQNPLLNEDLEMQTLHTNGLGFTRVVGEAFRIMVENGGGHIAIVSSIAGTKGLGPAPSYSATKAFQNTYIQALCQLANNRRLNISFTDIRPGFVDTELLNDGKRYPMLMSAESVAKKAIRAIEKKKNICTIDWRWCLITMLWKCIPACMWQRIRLIR